jgi:hypothetical protein
LAASISRSPDARHAGRNRARRWAALCLAAAAFGMIPLTLWEVDVALIYWGTAALGLGYTWLLMSRLNREAPRVARTASDRLNDRPGHVYRRV